MRHLTPKKVTERVALLVALAACNGEGSGDPTDANPTDGPAGTLPDDACVDGGPDAPVEALLQPDTWDFQGFPVVSYVPERPRGVIFYFHGGADVGEVGGDEHIAVMWNMMAAKLDFAVVATQRTATPATASWDNSSSVDHNDDAQRLDALRDHLIETSALEESTPVVFSGFSDGAGMATGFAEIAIDELGWPVVASIAHNGAMGSAPPVPTQLQIGQNDLDSAVMALDAIVRDMEEMEVVVDPIDVPERVLEVEQFLRHVPWDQELAQACFDDVVAAGLVDEAGVRRVPDESIEDALAVWERRSELQGAGLCASRMHVLWATHRYSGWAGQRECQFILDALP